MALWLAILGVPAGMLALAWTLRGKGRVGTANSLLAVLAAPFVLGLLFLGLFVVLQPDMR